MLLKVIKIRLDELAVYLGSELFGAVVGAGIMALMVYLGGEDPVTSVFRLGTVLAFIVGCFVQLLLGIFGLFQLFNYEVAFGMTRKNFICYDAIVSLIFGIVSLLFVGVLYIAEGGILKIFWSAYPEKDMLGMLNLTPWVMGLGLIAAVVCLTAMREFFGSLLMRFGNKAFWVTWALWMVITTIIPARLSKADQGGVISDLYHGVTRWIANLPAAAWGVTGTILVIAAFVLSWVIIRKQAVSA